MKKFYNVQLTYIGVVYAEDEFEAHTIAVDSARDIVDDSMDPKIDVTHQIKSKSDFRDGWDAECIGYGHDGNTRIAEIDENLK